MGGRRERVRLLRLHVWRGVMPLLRYRPIVWFVINQTLAAIISTLACGVAFGGVAL